MTNQQFRGGRHEAVAEPIKAGQNPLEKQSEQRRGMPPPIRRDEPMTRDPHPQTPAPMTTEAKRWLSENRPEEARRIRDLERRK